jgi:hypothetical protein
LCKLLWIVFCHYYPTSVNVEYTAYWMLLLASFKGPLVMGVGTMWREKRTNVLDPHRCTWDEVAACGPFHLR